MTRAKDTSLSERHTAPPAPAAAYEAARALAVSIEDERRRIGELALADLNNPEVINAINKLERLINEYMLMTYVNAGHRGKVKGKLCPAPRPAPSASVGAGK